MERRVSLGAPGAPGGPSLQSHSQQRGMRASFSGQSQPLPPSQPPSIPDLQAPPPYDVRGVPIVAPGNGDMAPQQQQPQQQQQQQGAPSMAYQHYAPYTSMPSDHMGVIASGMPQGPMPVYTAGGMMGAGGAGVNGPVPGPGTVTDEHYASGVEDSNDAKRRRIARACDMCRKKKIKCDGRMPKCSHCINYKTECIFTQVEKKRNPPKGAKYIEGLENRLSRMESLLRLSGLLSESDFGKTDLGVLEKRLAEKSMAAAAAAKKNTSNLWPTPDGVATPTGFAQGSGMPSMLNSPSGYAAEHPAVDSHQSTPRVTHSQADSRDGSPTWKGSDKLSTSWSTRKTSDERDNERQEHISDMMCSLITDSCGETRYIGSSSGFSIFSPRGIQWVNEKTGDNSFQNMISSSYVDDNKWNHWKPEIFSEIFARRVFKPLPPRDEAMSLLRDYFENFNCLFPLYHEPTFMHLVERQYSRDPYEGSGWWASLNVVLAIAHRLRVLTNLVPQKEDKLAWLYLKNAMGVLTELTMRNTDLLSVQALLGMALFLQGSPNPQPTFFLVAAAMRVAHGIGLHKRGYGFNLNPVEVEQRKRVFWIAYSMDKDICLRSGRPAVQNDDDMNVELPSEDPPDNVGTIPLSDGKGKLNLFRVMCRYGLIASKVYKLLYSTRASQQSDGELLHTIGELDQEIEEWKESIPIEYRPGHEIATTHPPLTIHIVILHLSYYNCLATIHRMSVHHGYWTSRLSDYAIQGLNTRPINPRVFSSAALCVQAARQTVDLIRYLPEGAFACIWLTLYFPISALVTLFAHLLQNPHDSKARSDVKLMNTVVSFLSRLVTDETNSSIRRMLGVCAEFERIAKVVVEKAEREAQGKHKRKSPSTPLTENDAESQNGDDEGSSGHTHLRADGVNDDLADHEGISPRMQFRRPSRTPNLNAGSRADTQPHTPASRTGNDMGSNMPPTSAYYQTEQQQQQQNFFVSANMMQDNMGQAHPQAQAAQSYTTSPDPNLPHVDMSGLSPFVPQDLWQMSMGLEWDWAYGPDFSGCITGGINGGMPGAFGLSETMNGGGMMGNPMFDDDNGNSPRNNGNGPP